MSLNKDLTVFLADDDLDDQDFFQKALHRINGCIRFTTAVNGEEALSKLLQSRDQPPDVIFLDVNMPRKNGMECLSEIRSTDELSHIPIVMYSTSFQEKDVRESKNHGALEFLRKPTSIRVLEDYLRSVLKEISLVPAYAG